MTNSRLVKPLAKVIGSITTLTVPIISKLVDMARLAYCV
jgi:hypothetical protein